MSIYQNILTSIKKSEKLLAVLIDPDQLQCEAIPRFISKMNNSIATHIFVGGSTVENGTTENLVKEIKSHTNLPIVLFPGDTSQITNQADAILFLSLISGRNSEYLIGKHVDAVPILKDTNLEVMPTGYLLIENGIKTAVQRISETLPISIKDSQLIVDTSIAGELLGLKLMYLEAGSGAKNPVPIDIISEVKKELNIPLIVGGGIRSKKQLYEAFNSGADMVVIGTAFEEDESFFNSLK